MTNERTIQMSDGTEIRVADDPRESEAIVTGATVSGSQKENLGNYENVEPHASVRLEFRPAIHMGSDGAASALQARLTNARKQVDQNLASAIESAREPQTRE